MAPDKDAPTDYWLAHLEAGAKTPTSRRLIALARERWRVEQDYRELKDELGLDHFEGRTQQANGAVTMSLVDYGYTALLANQQMLQVDLRIPWPGLGRSRTQAQTALISPWEISKCGRSWMSGFSLARWGRRRGAFTLMDVMVSARSSSNLAADGLRACICDVALTERAEPDESNTHEIRLQKWPTIALPKMHCSAFRCVSISR